MKEKGIEDKGKGKEMDLKKMRVPYIYKGIHYCDSQDELNQHALDLEGCRGTCQNATEVKWIEERIKELNERKKLAEVPF